MRRRIPHRRRKRSHDSTRLSTFTRLFSLSSRWKKKAWPLRDCSLLGILRTIVRTVIAHLAFHPLAKMVHTLWKMTIKQMYRHLLAQKPPKIHMWLSYQMCLSLVHYLLQIRRTIFPLAFLPRQNHHYIRTRSASKLRAEERDGSQM